MSRPSSAAQPILGVHLLAAAFLGRGSLRHLPHHATRRRTQLLPRARTPMLQSDSRVKTLGDLPALAVNFFALQRRYGAGVSTSGSQPENPGSIPGTATKLSRLISSASHARKPRTSHQIAKRQLLLDNPESCLSLAPSVIVTPCHQSKIWNVPVARPRFLRRRRRLSAQNAKVLSTSATICNRCAESPHAMRSPAMPLSLPGPVCGAIVPSSQTHAPLLSAKAGLPCFPAAAIPVHS